MTKLADVFAAGQQQMTIDEYLALDRDEAPPKAVAVATYGASVANTGGVSRPKKGRISHNGLCPYTAKCDERRRRLSHYREGVACPWVTWWNVAGCPIFKNGGNDK